MSNGVSHGKITANNHPPTHLELRHKNPLDNEDNKDIQSTPHITVAYTENTDDNREVPVSNSVYTNVLPTTIQGGGGSPINQNRPPSSTSSLMSTISPTSSVVIGRDDPFICGGTTPTCMMDNFNIGIDGSEQPVSSILLVNYY